MDNKRLEFKAFIGRENKDGLTEYKVKVMHPGLTGYENVYSFSTVVGDDIKPNKNHLTELINSFEVDIMNFSEIFVVLDYCDPTELSVYVDGVFKHKESINHKYQHKLINTLVNKTDWLFFEKSPHYSVKDVLNDFNVNKRLEDINLTIRENREVDV